MDENQRCIMCEKHVDRIADLESRLAEAHKRIHDLRAKRSMLDAECKIQAERLSEANESLTIAHMLGFEHGKNCSKCTDSLLKGQWDEMELKLAKAEKELDAANECHDVMHYEFEHAQEQLAGSEKLRSIAEQRLSVVMAAYDGLQSCLTEAKNDATNYYAKCTELMDENKTLKKELDELKKFTYCAYCGLEIHMDDSAATKIGEHIKSCDKHPMRIVEKERDAMQLCVDACIEFVRKVECGEARSRRSYAQMKEALAALDRAKEQIK